MNSTKTIIEECLDNEIKNGYDHNYDKSPDEIVDEIIEYTGEIVDYETAKMTVENWRQKNDNL